MKRTILLAFLASCFTAAIAAADSTLILPSGGVSSTTGVVVQSGSTKDLVLEPGSGKSVVVSSGRTLAVTTGTVAAAGTNQGTATAISAQETYVTAADNAKGVILPAAPIGSNFDIYGTVASKNLNIYPDSGAAINGGSANAAVTLYSKKAMRCSRVAALTWKCGVLAVPGTRTLFVPAGIGRAGATAGWVNTGTDINQATVAASQTAATFTIPVVGLQLGDTIESFKVIGQVESAGGAVTIDADLREQVNAAGDPTDGSLGTITQVAVTADTAVAASKTLSTAELIDSGDQLYVLLTATTAGSTDIRLLGIEVVVRREN